MLCVPKNKWKKLVTIDALERLTLGKDGRHTYFYHRSTVYPFYTICFIVPIQKTLCLNKVCNRQPIFMPCKGWNSSYF